jgi:uncharacterized membrane protein YjdF
MKKGVKVLSYFMAIFLVVFLGYFLLQGNYEFSAYGVVAGFLFFVLVWSDKYYDFPLTPLWLVAIWVVLHMLGGGVYISGTRLYDLLLIDIINRGGEFVILKYDQFVHLYCYLAISSVIYFMLKRHMKKGEEKALVVFSILAAIGVGLLNEVIEFAMVVFADAGEAVGGYYNTALDLVFNLIGAVVGTGLTRKFLD